ncbi:TetR family transcriptional regulator [Bifidobacterium saguini DSM 23967]|uniref:TetR family transcriptional regulator n=2 Tax=Bifidobacterium saguini TaxID=762210 RepID=A0A087DF61_9BIFI|nr:TetR/AcrR family transcriptional regulator [Bifidobacterium saguini]KFI94161.1 TetR family transcriptional regulator [Bifidobacterium saguini DSM 23967]QTB90456.1 TetR/AcrR family transcriptional regulator [Bifidobacterium saguini]
MARPKTGEQSAPERMQDAFWQLLEQKPYAQITISDVTRLSGLNRSAFYYHYGNIPELADDAIASIYGDPDITAFIAHIIRQDEGIDAICDYAIASIATPQRVASIRKLALIAGPHGSTGLVNQLKSHVIEIWLATLGCDSEALNPGQRIVLEFASSGMLGILAQAPAVFTPENITWLSRSILPDTIAQLINSLKSDSSTPQP